MQEVTVVVPNYNGSKYLRECLNSLLKQNYVDFETVVVDNGSTDNSIALLNSDYSWVKLIALPENYGFSRAVNEGIQYASTPYVILLNNDTAVDSDFVESLLKSIKRSKKRFSCQGKMIQYYNREKMDDAGNFYNALGWAFARGKDRPVEHYDKPVRVFACCAGASIYRKSVFDEIGYFDEEHFAYLEDLDVGYRARLQGYRNMYEPEAIVYHVGSGTSGSRYNLFKIRYSSRNNIYMIYKNMPFFQILLNLPFLVVGFIIKAIFFGIKGYGKEYVAGIFNGFCLCKKDRKFRIQKRKILNYVKIQLELWVNIVKRVTDK